MPLYLPVIGEKSLDLESLNILVIVGNKVGTDSLKNSCKK